MYILGLMLVLIIGVWFVPFVVHISIKVHQIYFEIEAIGRIFGYRFVRRRWRGNWLTELIEKWKASADTQAELEEQENENHIRGVIPNILRMGRWETFIWRMEVGLDDAMATAIIAGGIWGLQGIIGERWIRGKNCRTEMSCRPRFDRLMLFNEVVCIVHFRFGDIIGEFVKGYLKSKGRKVV